MESYCNPWPKQGWLFQPKSNLKACKERYHRKLQSAFCSDLGLRGWRHSYFEKWIDQGGIWVRAERYRRRASCRGSHRPYLQGPGNMHTHVWNQKSLWKNGNFWRLDRFAKCSRDKNLQHQAKAKLWVSVENYSAFGWRLHGQYNFPRQRGEVHLVDCWGPHW